MQDVLQRCANDHLVPLAQPYCGECGQPAIAVLQGPDCSTGEAVAASREAEGSRAVIVKVPSKEQAASWLVNAKAWSKQQPLWFWGLMGTLAAVAVLALVAATAGGASPLDNMSPHARWLATRVINVCNADPDSIAPTATWTYGDTGLYADSAYVDIRFATTPGAPRRDSARIMFDHMPPTAPNVRFVNCASGSGWFLRDRNGNELYWDRANGTPLP